MNKTREDLIVFRLQKATKALALARYSISKKYWDEAASELYYTCFYLVLALFAKKQCELFNTFRRKYFICVAFY